MPKIDANRALFAVVTVCLSVLVGLKRVDVSYLLTLVAWLMRSPFATLPPTQSAPSSPLEKGILPPPLDSEPESKS